MELFLVAVKDTAVDAFQPGVHTVRARGEAMRNFTDAVNDPNSKQLHAHPEDFELWLIATWDDHTGEVKPQLLRLARALDVKNT